jgi:NAD(P)-dependent dehydrogenase (short-subunit alcohol dehydrogenase family)
MVIQSQNTAPYRYALITGGAVRIGKAISSHLAKMGLGVAIHYRHSSQDADTLATQIIANGGHAITLGADLANPNETSSLLDRAAEGFGAPIDVLINNASEFQQDRLETVSIENWDRHQNVNLRAPVILSQALAKQLPSQRFGCVINIIDQRVLKLNPQYFSYTASKAGLWTVTRTMAQALAPSIRVNAVSPGPTLGNTFQSEQEFTAEAASVPLKHGPELAEICTAIQFLLETPSMTGQMLTLDGGQHLAWRTEDIQED